jgi:hypothetical protein
MTTTIQRSCQRTAHQVPIQFALLNTDRFHPGRTFNFSSTGLCYETHEPLKPGTDVCIVMANYDPDVPGPECYRSYVASIRWTRLLSKNGTECYAAGARFITCSHDIITAENQLPYHLCDLCGARRPLNKIDRTQVGAHLCANCMKHYNNMPSGKIRQCVERFLVGNII